MTPFEIGLSAFYIVLGLAVGIGLFCLLFALIRAIDEATAWREHQRLYGKFMNPDHWRFVEVEQAPNPDYWNLTYRNSATNEDICLGLKKDKLPMNQNISRSILHD